MRRLTPPSTLSEVSFLFVVGEEEFRFHPSVIKAVSEPLHRMMVNGLGESVNRRAVLPEIDSQTFAAFCTYACRLCFVNGVEVLSFPVVSHTHLLCDGLASFCCHICRVQVIPNPTKNVYPFCGGHDQHVPSWLNDAFCTSCGTNKLPAAVTVDLYSPPIRFCGPCVAKQSMCVVSLVRCQLNNSNRNKIRFGYWSKQ
jgi:hypothetical protein